MESEPKQSAQAFDALKAEVNHPDAIVCWTQFLREQDEREQHQREGKAALGTPEGLAPDEDGQCEPGEAPTHAGER